MVKLRSPSCSFLIMVTLFYTIEVDSKKCHGECTALASYYLWGGANLTLLTEAFNTNYSNIMGYNPQIYNFDKIYKGQRVNVPFQCGCLRGSDSEFLGHRFSFKSKTGNTYKTIADIVYSRLTRVEWLVEFNDFHANQRIEKNQSLDVPVLCSCGNKKVSKDYGLFITYPLRPGENLSLVAKRVELSEKLLMDYNPGVDFSSGSGMVFIPGKDQTGSYPQLKLSSSRWFFTSYSLLKILAGKHVEAIASLCIAGVTGTLALAAFFYYCVYKRRIFVKRSFIHPVETKIGSSAFSGICSLRHMSIITDKSLEFPYSELAEATRNFSLANKIGEGESGSVYYAELRGEKVAIKKMDMQASKVFVAELKVLTNIHHLNLVRLIGYAVEGSLFIVYEFMANGNLRQHLRGFPGKAPLSWSSRVQIALDAARGLEYLHEHTNPAYVHHDIKSSNILLDINLRAKVAKFGLAKLEEVGAGSFLTQFLGTFGYMPPEYYCGVTSTKKDVYAFGVVLYELISARAAIVKYGEDSVIALGLDDGEDSMREVELVAMFEEVMNQPDPSTDLLRGLVMTIQSTRFVR
ncbi:chitin elicitor receptor kinase 1-like [Daucus carota subsp. sativus]|uniref:chitin elicitor receptor kinase 1-like n=1 Tax=Daucus carota subsp. sativus TaxID=79200 RepID=UPI003082F052